MVLVLERADRVRHALDGVGLAVRPVVHRVDGPSIAGALVRRLADAIHDRIAQVDVAAGHVDLRAQRLAAVGKLAGAHAPEEIEVLLDRAVSERRGPPTLRQRPARLAHLLRGLIVDVCLAGRDELLSPPVELLEVIAGVMEVLTPVEAQPAHVVHDRVDVLLALFGRVGVIEAQVAAAAVVARQPEVDADGLGVADVQVAVGLGRKARHHLAAEAAGADVLLDDLADEVTGFRRVAHEPPS